jgi:hypothetical protein
MPSLKQTEANRLNAKKSTGPRTPAGKAKSRFNALKAGIDAGAEAIPGEDADQLRALRDDYYDRFTPDRPEEYALVDSLIAADWLLRRLRTIEGQLWKQGVAEAREWLSFNPATPLASALPSVENSLTRLQRRIDSADRAYHRALNQIRRLQHAPLVPFESEPLPGDPAKPAGPPPPAAQPASSQSQHDPPPPGSPPPNQAIGFVPSIPVAPHAPQSAAPSPSKWGRLERNMQNSARQGERE